MRDKLKRLTNLFYELGTLKKIARSHRQTLLTEDLSDNIASHSYRVAMMGWFLAKLEKADPNKVVMMGLWHDAGEARTGDQNWIHKKYVKVFDSEVIRDQLDGLVSETELLETVTQYEKRVSIEAKLAKDADLLDQLLLIREYEWRGNQEAKRWLENNQQIKHLFSKSAKKIAKEILVQRPSDWWTETGWSAERRD